VELGFFCFAGVANNFISSNDTYGILGFFSRTVWLKTGDLKDALKN
jgi:hypothetical protein